MRTEKGLPLHLIALRHSKAAAAVDGVDESRVLSPVGIELAQKRIASFKDINVVLGVSSVANRAIETAKIVFGTTPFIGLPELYLPLDEKDRIDGDKAFAELLYSPLRTYIAKDTTGWLFRYGLNAVSAIRKVVSEKLPIGAQRGGRQYVVVAGHAVFANLIAMLMFPEHAEQLQDICLGEAEALVVGQDRLQHISGDAKIAP